MHVMIASRHNKLSFLLIELGVLHCVCDCFVHIQIAVPEIVGMIIQDEVRILAECIMFGVFIVVPPRCFKIWDFAHVLFVVEMILSV